MTGQVQKRRVPHVFEVRDGCVPHVMIPKSPRIRILGLKVPNTIISEVSAT